MQEFEQFLIKQQLRPKTILEYVPAVIRFTSWYEDNYDESLDITSLQDSHLIQYRSFLISRLHARTVNKNLAALRKWLVFQQRKGLWNSPVELSDVPIAHKQEPRWLPKKDVSAILYAIEQEKNDFLRARDRCMVFLELFRGLRIDESLSLRMDDVILTSGRQKLIIREGKGGVYGELDISGSRKVLGAIRDWMDERIKGKYADSPYFFISFNSGHLTYGAVEKMVKRLRRRSGVFFTTHMLRHTHGHDIQEQTKDSRKTMQALRQRDIRSTVIYTQPSKEEMQTIYKDVEDRY